MAQRTVPRNSDGMEGHREGGFDGERYGYRSEAPDSPSAQREAGWEISALSRSIRHEDHGRRFDNRPSDGHIESDDIPSSGFNGPGYGGRRPVDVGSAPTSRGDMFGYMAPCWRLLERAQAYMDKVCTLYYPVGQPLLPTFGTSSILQLF